MKKMKKTGSVKALFFAGGIFLLLVLLGLSFGILKLIDKGTDTADLLTIWTSLVMVGAAIGAGQCFIRATEADSR